MERSIVEILTNQDHTKVGLMSMNGGETMGLGMDVDITEIEDKLTPAASLSIPWWQMDAMP